MNKEAIPTSQAILADLNDVLRDLQGLTEKDSEFTWTAWRYSFIAAVLPVVVFLEQSDVRVEAADVADLNRLDDLVGRSTAAFGPGFEPVVTGLRSFLFHLPAYRDNRCGQQELVTVEKFSFLVMDCRNLLALSKRQVAP